uniref:Uncharacterized protein n=1 Tax=Sus scrofa TaxID=9823 RepID=A0A4X1VBP5_PIG
MPCTEINSKWLKDLNIRHDTIKLLEGNTGKTFSDINYTNVFLGQSPEALEIKTKVNKWELFKLTSFFIAKETLKKKKNSTEWEKIVTNDTTDKGVLSKIYNNSKKKKKKANNHPTENWEKDLNRHFFKEDTWMARRHMKKCSTPLIIREKQIKTIMRYYLTQSEWPSLTSLQITNAGEGVEKRELSYSVSGNTSLVFFFLCPESLPSLIIEILCTVRNTFYVV